MGREQNLQEIHPAFGVGREERGEQVVADVQRVPALAAVAGGGVVGLQIVRDLAGGRQQTVFLLVERFVPFGQQAIDLPGRDVDPQFQQLLVQQRLRDVVVKMLVQHVLPERRTEMRRDVLRQGSGDDRAVRQLVAASGGTACCAARSSGPGR